MLLSRYEESIVLPKNNSFPYKLRIVFPAILISAWDVVYRNLFIHGATAGQFDPN